MKGMSNTEAYFMRMAGTLYRSAYEEGYADGKKDCCKWISVKDRLPEENGEYLVVWNDSPPRVGETCYSQKRKEFGFDWWNDEEGKLVWMTEEAITHWMPLPELPSEVENDG